MYLKENIEKQTMQHYVRKIRDGSDFYAYVSLISNLFVSLFLQNSQHASSIKRLINETYISQALEKLHNTITKATIVYLYNVNSIGMFQWKLSWFSLGSVRFQKKFIKELTLLQQSEKGRFLSLNSYKSSFRSVMPKSSCLVRMFAKSQKQIKLSQAMGISQ